MRIIKHFSYIILLPCLMMMSCKKHPKIHIEGLVDSMNGIKVRIANTDLTVSYDSAIIKNNKFRFNSTVPSPGIYVLDFSSPDASFHGMKWVHSCTLYIEDKANYTFKATGPFEVLQELYTVSASSYNEQKLDEYKILVKAKRAKAYSAIKLFSGLRDRYFLAHDYKNYSNCIDSISRFDSIRSNSNTTTMREFIRKTPNTVLTPYFITQLGDYSENYTLYHRILTNLSPEIKRTVYFDQAMKLLADVENLRIGKEIPPIAGTDINDKPFGYAFSKHRYTLVEFWASNFPECSEDFAELKPLYQKYRSKGFSVISVSIDEKKGDWLKASAKDSLQWYNVCEAVKQEDSKNIKNFTLTIVPINFLLNEHGQLISKNVSINTLGQFLSNKLDKPNANTVSLYK